MSNAHCCVIGGAGFIGSYLIKQLILTGRKITIIGRSNKPSSHLPEQVCYISNQYGDKDFLNNALKDVDEIVDLAYATIPKTSFSDPINDITSNLPEAVKLFNIVAQLPIRKIVWVSSGGTVYGKTDKPIIDETHPTNPISPYGITKLAIEKYALMYKNISNLPIVCVRPANAYGEEQRPFAGQGFVATAIASILKGEEIVVFGEKGTIRDYIHADDIASGILAALEKGTTGNIYNIGTGIGRSNREVLGMIMSYAKASDLSMSVRTLPLREFDVQINILDSRKLTADTGWKPKISFEEGLLRTWNWFTQR